jgi:hypothetical protein
MQLGNPISQVQRAMGKKYFKEVWDECYQDAREQASDETGLPINTFPVKAPFTPSETLNFDYLP